MKHLHSIWVINLSGTCQPCPCSTCWDALSCSVWWTTWAYLLRTGPPRVGPNWHRVVACRSIAPATRCSWGTSRVVGRDLEFQRCHKTRKHISWYLKPTQVFCRCGVDFTSAPGLRKSLRIFRPFPKRKMSNASYSPKAPRNSNCYLEPMIYWAYSQ